MPLANSYDADPLDVNTRSIRLLRVLGLKSTGSIECELRCFPLTSTPSYTALSYTWGVASLTRTIYVNGRPFVVRENIWHFLEGIRKHDKTDYLWIDALCIDQSNIRERNHQVGLMREIYQRAANVNIWLGPGTEDSKKAMGCIGNLQRKKTIGQFRKLWTRDQGKAILQLCQKNYWRRVWIVQEIMLGKAITIQWGSESIEWDCLQSMVHQLRAIEQAGRIYHQPHIAAILESDAVRIIETKTTWHNLHFEDKAIALAYLLDKFSDMECTEIRDRVYGHLGLLDHLAPNGRALSIAIDYGKTLPEVFAEAERAMQSLGHFPDLKTRLDLVDRLKDVLRLPPSDEVVEWAKYRAPFWPRFWFPSDLLPWDPMAQGRTEEDLKREARLKEFISSISRGIECPPQPHTGSA